MRDDDYLYDLFPLEHKPLRPPRQGHIGEAVYCSMWETFMARRNDAIEPDAAQFADVLANFPKRINQRHATVVASIVCWLGTSCGRGFIDQAKRIGDERPFHRQDKFILAWALENHRRGFVNSGVRTIEHCMAHDPRRYPDGLPELSADDYEAAECLMQWLGTGDGEQFITCCEQEITRLHRIESDKKIAEWRRNIDSQCPVTSGLDRTTSGAIGQP